MKPRRVTVLMNPKLYALVDELARASGESVSELIRALIADKLRQEGVFYEPSILKMPKGTRTDLEDPDARAAFVEKTREQLARAREVRSRRAAERRKSAESASMLA